MKSSFRILLAELICLSLIFTQIIGPVFVFADEIALPITEPATGIIEQSGVPVDTGTTVSQDIPSIQTDTGVTISQASLSSSGDTLTGNVVVPSLSGSEASTGTSIVTDSGTTQESAIVSTGSTASGIVENSPVPVTPSRSEEVIPVVQVPAQNRTKNIPIDGSEILIQFHEDNINLDTFAGKYQLDQIETAHNLITTDTIENSNIAVMKIADSAPQASLSEVDSIKSSFNSTGAVDTLIRELRKDPRIAHVQRNYIYRITTAPSRKAEDAKVSYDLRPNPSPRFTTDDSDFSKLWGLDNQGQEVDGVSGEVDADVDYPEAMAYASGKLTHKVIVAIIDTGIEGDHPDIAGNLWDGANCVSDTGASLGGCQHGYDFVDDDTDPADSSHVEHGTHVAGTIGAIVNNGVGVTGISPNVSIMPLRVCDDWGCSTAAIVRAVNFARLNGAQVINASLGGTQIFNSISDFDYLSYDAIQAFPGLFVAAAGNSGENTDTIKNFPSGFGSDTVVSGEMIVDREMVITGSVTIPALQNVIAVAASDQNDALAWFSNYGTGSVHIAAPGTSIYSSVMTTDSGTTDSISYENGWMKQSSVSGEYWNTRSTVVSGEYIDLSGALWTDTRLPYASGSSAYIQKDFTGLTEGNYTLAVETWCDTSSGYYDGNYDYMDVLMSTGGLFSSVSNINEDTILYYGSNGYNPTYVDGHVGYAGKVNIAQGYFDRNTSIRIKWKTDSTDSDTYGCAVKNITISSRVPGYEYKQGTSMASPHVAGAAALAWNYKPNATVQDVRNAILYGADYKSSLSRTQTSSRLNLLGMLKALEKPIIDSRSVTFSGAKTAILNFKTDVAASGFLSYSTDSGAWNVEPKYTFKNPINPSLSDHEIYSSSATGSTEVARFAISSESANGTLTSLQFSMTGSFHSSLSDIVDSLNIELWDLDTDTKVSTDVHMYDSTLYFDGLMEDFPNDTTKNYKVVFTYINNVSPYFGQTFSIIPTGLWISNPDYNGGIQISTTFEPTINTITIARPTTSITVMNPLLQNSKIATIRVTNTDNSSDLTLSGITLGVSFISTGQSMSPFSGSVCLRDRDSRASCGTLGATQGTQITQSGGYIYFNIEDSLLSDTGVTLLKNGGSIEYELYIDNAPLWMEGDSVNVVTTAIQYSPYTTAPVVSHPILTLKDATVAAPSTNTISSVSLQEVGRFALTSSGEDIRVTRLSVSGEGTFVSTLSDVVDPSSVELWNADTNTQIPAIVSLEGNTVVFDSMTNDIIKDTTENLKIVFSSVKSLDANYGNTLQFSLHTENITATPVDSLHTVVFDGSATMKEYRFGVVPPTILLTANTPLTQNAKLATLRVTNIDSNTGITLSGITLQFQARSTSQGGFAFSGAICLRDLGSTAFCGDIGTTTAQSTTGAGGTYSVNISTSQLSNAQSILTQNGGYIEYEVYLDNAPLWIAGDAASVTLRSVEYSTLNGVTQTESLVGVSGASAVGTKSIKKSKTVQSIPVKRYSGYSQSGSDNLPYTTDTLDHTFTLTGLTEDTTYYYTVSMCGSYLCNDDAAELHSFHTPKSASTTVSTTVTSTGTLYLSGATSTGIVFSGSTGSGHIILANTGNTVSVSIPTSGLIISASGAWDGVLEAPTMDTGSLTISLTGGSVAVNAIYRIGNSMTPLALSGQVATISIAIIAINGYQVNVYRSNATGLPYVQIGTCIVQSNTCTFTTDHFSLFALGNPVAPTVVPSSGGGSSSFSSNGPSGGGSSSSPYSILIPVDRSRPMSVSVSSSGKTSVISLAPKAHFASDIAKALTKKNIPVWIQRDAQTLSSDMLISILQIYILNSESKIQSILAYNSAINATSAAMKATPSISVKSKLKKVLDALKYSRKEYIKNN